MGRVDVEDDSIRRFVVRHYRYDPERHERRHVIVGAFDNEAEFNALMASIRDDIERRRRAGEPMGPNEHASGTVYEPGDRARAAVGHQVRRMIEHGVDPQEWVDQRELPSNMALLTNHGPSDGDSGERLGKVGRIRRILGPLRGARRPE